MTCRCLFLEMHGLNGHQGPSRRIKKKQLDSLSFLELEKGKSKAKIDTNQSCVCSPTSHFGHFLIPGQQARFFYYPHKPACAFSCNLFPIFLFFCCCRPPYQKSLAPPCFSKSTWIHRPWCSLVRQKKPAAGSCAAMLSFFLPRQRVSSRSRFNSKALCSFSGNRVNLKVAIAPREMRDSCCFNEFTLFSPFFFQAQARNWAWRPIIKSNTRPNN